MTPAPADRGLPAPPAPAPDVRAHRERLQSAAASSRPSYSDSRWSASSESDRAATQEVDTSPRARSDSASPERSTDRAAPDASSPLISFLRSSPPTAPTATSSLRD